MAITTPIEEREFDVIAALSQQAIRASIRELSERDRLTIALRTKLNEGADINDLSAASGLTPTEIRRRIAHELVILSDLDIVAGIV